MSDIEKANYFYHKEYLPNFDKAEGEPVCFDEFYNNDWGQWKGEQ